MNKSENLVVYHPPPRISGCAAETDSFSPHGTGAGGAELPVVSPGPLNQLDTAQVLAALEQLDEIYRSPVALFYLQDYSYLEIAGILEVPIGTVKSRLARGLDRLHQLLTGGTVIGSSSPQTDL